MDSAQTCLVCTASSGQINTPSRVNNQTATYSDTATGAPSLAGTDVSPSVSPCQLTPCVVRVSRCAADDSVCRGTMWSLSRRCSRLVLLLTLLWTVGRSEASQSQPSADVGATFDPQQVLRLIVHEVTANLQLRISQLVSRNDVIDGRRLVSTPV